MIKIPKERIKQKIINGSKYYMYRVMKNGVSKTFYGKTIKELNEKYNEYLSTKEVKTPHKKSNNFGILFERYLQLKKCDWKIQTYISRLGFYEKHLKGSALSKMQIQDVDKQSILDFIDKLKLSFNTKKEKLCVLKQFINYCIDEGLVENNVVKAIRLKNRVVLEEECNLSPSTVKALLEGCRGSEIEPIIIGMCNGMRLGEAMALNKNNIRGNYIYINESLTTCTIEGKVQYLLETPKNDYSFRRVYLSEEHINIFLSCSTDNKGYYAHYRGRWISRSRIYNYLKLYNCKPHDLRKFYTSYLLMNGTNVYAVKAQLGHSKASQLTESVYLQTGNYIEKEMMKYF